VKAVPVSVTVVPTKPLVGVKLVIAGATAAKGRQANTREANRLAKRDLIMEFLMAQTIFLAIVTNRWTTV
jgi:hypothetical protein